MSITLRSAPALVLLLAGLSVNAADHRDAPLIQNDPAADLNDVYAFMNPNDAGELILVATVMPFATDSARFSRVVEYRLNLQNASDGSRPKSIRCRFPGRKVVCRGPGRSHVAGRLGRINERRGLRVFAGLRDDPFFFDAVAFQQTVATLVPQFSDPGNDTFEGSNVLAVVIGIDTDLLGNGNDSVWRVYGSTHRRDNNGDDDSDSDSSDNDSDSSDDDSDSSDDNSHGRSARSFTQLDRAGRPGITTALIDLLAATGLKDSYNQAEDIRTWAPLFEAEIAANLAALDTLDGVVGNNLLPPDVLASVLVDDRLFIDVAIPLCDAYLAVELGVPQCGGRTLERDVIDDTFGAVVGPGVSDFVGNTSVFLDHFPFLGHPNRTD